MKDIRIHDPNLTSHFTKAEEKTDQLSEEILTSMDEWASKWTQHMIASKGNYHDQTPPRLKPSAFVNIQKLPTEFKNIDIAIDIPFKKNDHNDCLWLIGRSLGGILLENFKNFAYVFSLCKHHQFLLFSLTSRVGVLLKKHPNKYESILHDYLHNTKKVNAYWLHGDQENDFQQMIIDWRKTTHISDIWKYKQYFSYYAAHFPAACLLSEIVENIPDLGAKILDRYNLIPLTEHVLYSSSIATDKDIILELIKKSPSTIANDPSNKWNHNIVAPMAIDIFLHHLDKIYESLGGRRQGVEADEKLQSFLTTEAPKLCKEASEVICSRIDSDFIVLHYCTKLVSKTTQDNNLTPALIFLEELTTIKSKQNFNLALVEKILGWDKANLNIKSARETGLPVNSDITINEFISMFWIASQNKADIDTQEWIDYFEILLFTSDNGLNVFRPTSQQILSASNYSLALLFVLAKDPANSWGNLWNNLSAIRHRTKYNPFKMNSELKNANKFILMIGICAFDWLTSKDYNQNNEADKLWELLWEATYSSWLVSDRIDNDEWNTLLLHILLRHKVIHYQNTPTLYAQKIEPYLKLCKGANQFVSEFACNLEKNTSLQVVQELKDFFIPHLKHFFDEENNIVHKHLVHLNLQSACNNLQKKLAQQPA